MSVAEIKPELSRLTNAERVEFLNAIWESLEEKDQDIESPTWHADILRERAAMIDLGQEKFLTVDELKERLTA